MTVPSWQSGSVATMVLVGAAGGAVRSLVGILKHLEGNRRGESFRVWYLLFSILISAVIGAFAGALSPGNWKIAGLAGYAGTDFIENLYKIKKAQGLET
jgi:hypothetical protein